MHTQAEVCDPLHVLMVDDNVDILRAAAALARSAGIVVYEAISGAEALRLLDLNHQIHILFSDILMPKLGGVELAREVNRRYPTIRVILTSALEPPSIPDTWSFLWKPYQLSDLIDAFLGR